ncbi:MAG: YebC/PmpR family DNA-binding transcriptional regulator [Deltaproteobacteria bacterium]|nr:YebC/PmpR family DNA-binding transcriptional regulator [Deltaproteobacteria bacterium]
MSGHSKWSTIKRKKGALDAKRSKIFTKLIREIVVSVRTGGGDVNGNPRLRLAVDKARGANMPKDNIERAIKKGMGGDSGEAAYEEITYEGYGPGGVAVYIDALTDNKNRTVGDVRHALTKFGGNLGANGCVAYLFEKKGVIRFDESAVDSEALMEAALEAGAEDVLEEDGSVEVITTQADFQSVRDNLAGAGFPSEDAEVTMEPSTMVELKGKHVGSMLKLMEMLEDLDDVQNVYANFDISEEEMDSLL